MIEVAKSDWFCHFFVYFNPYYIKGASYILENL